MPRLGLFELDFEVADPFCQRLRGLFDLEFLGYLESGLYVDRRHCLVRGLVPNTEVSSCSPGRVFESAATTQGNTTQRRSLLVRRFLVVIAKEKKPRKKYSMVLHDNVLGTLTLEMVTY